MGLNLKLDILSELSPSREMKKLQYMLQLEASKLKPFLIMPLRLRSTSWEEETSLMMVTSDSVSKNTSISESSMIPTPVFSVWISTLSSPELERESPRESTPEANSENSKESLLMMPSNGSLRSALEPSFERPRRIHFQLSTFDENCKFDDLFSR